MFATSTEKESASDWIVDFECNHRMCPHKDPFSTNNPADSTIVQMGNSAQYNIARIDSVKIKTYDGVVRTLSNVRHVSDSKCNPISLGTLESKGCKCLAEDGVLKVSKGTRILLKGLRKRSLYVLQGFTMASTTTYSSFPNDIFTYPSHI